MMLGDANQTKNKMLLYLKYCMRNSRKKNEEKNQKIQIGFDNRTKIKILWISTKSYWVSAFSLWMSHADGVQMTLHINSMHSTLYQIYCHCQLNKWKPTSPFSSNNVLKQWRFNFLSTFFFWNSYCFAAIPVRKE